MCDILFFPILIFLNFILGLILLIAIVLFI